MLDKNKKRKLFIIFFCLSLIFSVLCFTISADYWKANAKVVFAFFSILFFAGGIVFFILFLLDKETVARNKIKKTQPTVDKENSMEAYDKFLEWWSDCDENEIANNSILLGAYRLMWYHNEVMNGGYLQFFDNKKSWDMQETAKLFKILLPKVLYEQFLIAYKCYNNGENCEECNLTYDDVKMQNVLEKSAERVMNILKYNVTLTEYDLIASIQPYLKQQGYKKQNKRWTKNVGDFTMVFLIQGSAFDIDSYYIRPGIVINELENVGYYGHFFIGINQHSVTQVIADFEKFISEWTNKSLTKERALQFVEWEKRNPLEKRRENSVDYEKDPCPDKNIFFHSGDYVIKYIIENF